MTTCLSRYVWIYVSNSVSLPRYSSLLGVEVVCVDVTYLLCCCLGVVPLVLKSSEHAISLQIRSSMWIQTCHNISNIHVCCTQVVMENSCCFNNFNNIVIIHGQPPVKYSESLNQNTKSILHNASGMTQSVIEYGLTIGKPLDIFPFCKGSEQIHTEWKSLISNYAVRQSTTSWIVGKLFRSR